MADFGSALMQVGASPLFQIGAAMQQPVPFGGDTSFGAAINRGVMNAADARMAMFEQESELRKMAMEQQLPALVGAALRGDQQALAQLPADVQLKVAEELRKKDEMNQPKVTSAGSTLFSYSPNDPDSTISAIGQGRPTSSVNVTNIQETAQNKKIGEGLADEYLGIVKAGREADADIARYQRLDRLLSLVDTGRYKGTTQELKKAAQTLGFDLSAWGIADDVALTEAAKAASAQMALELRNPSGGAGMPGALSDKDREFLQSMVPGIETTTQGRRLMVNYRTKLAKRNKEVAQKARDYRRRYGNIDEGFYDELSEYAEANPMFSDEDIKEVESLSGLAGGGKTKVLKYNPSTGRLE